MMEFSFFSPINTLKWICRKNKIKCWQKIITSFPVFPVLQILLVCLFFTVIWCWGFAHLQLALCRWRRSSQSPCWLKRCQSPRWSDCSGRSTVMSRRSSWQTGRRSVSSPSRSVPSLLSCCHSTGLNPACSPRAAAPNLSHSNDCNCLVLLLQCLEAMQRLPAGRSAVP